MTLTPDQIFDLPPGAKFQVKDKNATATVTKKENGDIDVESHCDSLNIVIERLVTTIEKYRSENTALQEQIKQKPVQVNVLSPWQAFRIKVGNITLCLLAVAALAGGYKLFNFIKSKIQK